MCKKFIYLTIFFALVLGLSGEQARGQSRAAYWDGNYGTAWAGDGGGTRDALEAAGYEILDADQLKTWMDAHIPNGKGSVVVFCKDAAPDTVVETMSDTCTLRRYLDAGGKIVWQADIPFYYMTTAGSVNTTWGDAGAPAILGFNTSGVARDVGGSTITDEGIEWGITESWGSQRAADPALVDIVLATDDDGNAAAWVKFFVPGDTGGGFVRIRDTGGQANVEDIMRVAEYGLGGNPFARAPEPADGAMHADTWVSMSWITGDFAVSHDVYFGENFDDVNDGTGDTFRGNQDLDTAFYIAGFPGYAYPDGLVPGTTYYWRVNEVNDANAASPWKGPVWSFSIPPKTAYFPKPADGTESVDLNVVLSWTAGFGAKLHYIVFGEDFDEVNDAVQGTPNGTTSYNPGPLNLAKTYYWRVDEFEAPATHKGEVWSFTTLGAVSGPNPADSAVDVKPSVILRWNAGAVAASHEVYFGTDADAVKNATTTSTEYKGPKALGEESYDPGILMLNTAYFWRIDEVNGINPDSPWAGNVWSFTTGDFFVIDDFEDYDAVDNQIWFAWHDGLGAGTPGTPGYIPGNGTGSAVGDETTLSYTEETIVNGGLQSMPLSYDNNQQGFAKYSEVELTLTDQHDWTQEGVTELSLWFRGNPASVGSFAEGPVGTYTMTASGADIWTVNGVEADEFHFAYKTLTGAGSMVARVDSIENTNDWAKAGVMIRETLDPDSAHAYMPVTPTQGVSFQRRPGTGATSTSDNSATGGSETAPYWVKIERSISGNFTASSSTNGSTWTPLGTPQNIPMGANVYIGLALTSHDAALTCQAVFSNVSTTGTVGPQWAHQDIGIASNAAEPLYVAVSNTTGAPVVVTHPDLQAAQIDTWTEWIIQLQDLADKGLVLTNVDRMAIGLGTQGNMTIPGGSGKMFFDDIRLYRPREAAE